MTGIIPASRHRISPVPAERRSYPVTHSPHRLLRAAQMYPAEGTRIWRAVNGRQRPIRISPRIVSSTLDHSGVPGAMECVSQRRAGSGSEHTIAGLNGSGSLRLAVTRRAQSSRTARATRGPRRIVGRPIAHCSCYLVHGCEWTMAIGQGACESNIWDTDPNVMPGRPPRPRQPTTSSCASWAAVSRALRAEATVTCR